MSSFVVGIDLGTTNSCVGVYKDGEVEIIENDLGYSTTPSHVTYTKDGVVTGPESVDIAHQYLESTIYGVKRLIGQRFSDPKVQEDIAQFHYHVFDYLDMPKIRIIFLNGETKGIYPEEVSASVLNRMKMIAEARLHVEVLRAVVTVPAYFNGGQRQATKDAATIAGFTTVNIINEPTAAAVAFNDQNKKPYKRHIVVYDFGGGTFDVSVVTMHKDKFEVKSTKGDCHLGGTDLDRRLAKFLIEKIKDQYDKTEAVLDQNTHNRLQNISERAKIKLSTQLQVNIELDAFLGLDYLTIPISRAHFEILSIDIFQKTLQLVDDCLQESGLTKDDITAAVLVGGSSNIPKIQSMLGDYFGIEKIHTGLNVDEGVAYGAAIYATHLMGDVNKVQDVISSSLGTNADGDLMRFIFSRNTPIPASTIEKYQTATDNQTTMDFSIYQGESKIASENYKVGHFSMTDLTEAAAEIVKVKVCYSIDEEGLLHIAGTEINANNEKDIEIDLKKRGLSKEKIKQLIDSAECSKLTSIKFHYVKQVDDFV